DMQARREAGEAAQGQRQRMAAPDDLVGAGHGGIVHAYPLAIPGARPVEMVRPVLEASRQRGCPRREGVSGTAGAGDLALALQAGEPDANRTGADAIQAARPAQGLY